MPDFLTRRDGTWHFVRRVPTEFAAFDARRIVRHSTKVRIREDRNGRRASRIADKLNADLEAFWQAAAHGPAREQLARYDATRHYARTLGFEYVERDQLVQFPIERLLERLEALVRKGVADQPVAAAAVLGTEKRPIPKLSDLFEEFEALVAEEIKDFSPEQRRIWRTARVRSVAQFVERVGDKPVTEVTEDDGLDYVDWWRGRIVKGDALAKTANRDIGQLSRMLKDVSVRRRLKIPDIFKGLRLRGETEKARVPYDVEFIQDKLLAAGALDGLNDEARHVLYVVADTGLRPSEVVNLTESAIYLDAPVPHVKILPEGRRLKTEDSLREIPLVGVALAAMRLHPKGFPRYRDKSSSLSSTLNKYLTENGLRPTEDHTVYSLRHSFKDRLIGAEAPDSLIDSLMGHKTYKPKYGRGPSLELKLKFMSAIAFRPPERL
jgi:integrase